MARPKKETTKTMREHVETGAKYSGSSVALAAAITVLIGVFIPQIKEDAEAMSAIQALLTFGLNLILIRYFKGS